MTKELNQFLKIALAEGLSYLALLFVAMPLKYLADMPLAVRVVGMIHGVLFVLYVLSALRASRVESWSRKTEFFVFVASLIPFGTFYLDARLKKR